MTKRLLKIIIPVAVLVVVFIAAIFVSISKFNVANHFAVLNGLYQIMLTDKPYAEIQAYPKVIIAKPHTSLKSYMEAEGFVENEDEQMGAVRVFENGDAKQGVIYQVNRYYSRWHWVE